MSVNKVMKTEKKIEQAAKRYVEERKKCGLESEVALDEVEAAFCAGAEFGVRLAEQEARDEIGAAFYLGLRSTACQWRKVDDPVQPEMLEGYLCYDGCSYVVAYKDGNDWFDTNSGDKVSPVAWCKFINAPQDIDENK